LKAGGIGKGLPYYATYQNESALAVDDVEISIQTDVFVRGQVTPIRESKIKQSGYK